MEFLIKSKLYVLVVIFLSCIVACGGGDDQPNSSETVKEVSPSSSTATAAPTATPTAQAIAQDKSTPTSPPATVQTQEQEAIEWITVEDEFKMYSIRLPKSWDTASKVDDLDQAQYLQLGNMGAILAITSTDPETGSNIMVWTDGAQLYVDEPQPIDLAAYTEGTLGILRDNPENDPSSIQTRDITVNGLKGTQIRRLMSGYPLIVNFFVGTADDPDLLCGSMVPTLQALYIEPQQESTIEEIMSSLKVLPTFKGDVKSCADRTQLSLLE